ncbi:four helix bundle protein [Flagellimonas myxillae]|uniref:four helix bundle protein n=1 Tax=Flagellimonas myxillae TaxID=2942214 RepID=UPI00201EC0E2|nr:four helix bundle protein [Muricauda myxillae]MCL6266791.1 four helix bundle protein [Muricauda myxillae]
MVDYRNYKVWQKAHLLVIEVYRATGAFPQKEQFGLVSQINRVVISIPAIIAEGCGRETQKELTRFLYISSGSALELDYLIMLSKELNFINDKQFSNLSSKIQEIKKMLASLIKIKQDL